MSESWSQYDAETEVVLTREISPSASTSARTFSKSGRIFETIDFSDVTNKFSYDGLGRLSETVDGRGLKTSRLYNEFGELESSIDSSGGITCYGYDSLGRLSNITDPNGNVRVQNFGQTGRVVYSGGSSYPVRDVFDLHGRRIARTTYQDETASTGQTVSWNYDNTTGLLLSTTDASGHSRRFTYDHGLLLTNVVLKTGESVSFEYDRWGRETLHRYSDGTPSVVKEYDALGRLIHVSDGFADTFLEYDEFGSLVSEIEKGFGFTNEIVRVYSSNGKYVGLLINGETNFACSVETSSGRIRECSAFGEISDFEFRYVPGTDVLDSLTYPNGILKKYEYSGSRNLPDRIAYLIGTNVLLRHEFLYDAGGRIFETSKNGFLDDAEKIMRCQYNSRSELTKFTLQKGENTVETSYSYDDIGNRVVSSGAFGMLRYAANEMNQYVSISNCVYGGQLARPTFDEEGNQTLVTTELGAWMVSYDGNNRPVSWQSGGTKLVMRYDYRDRRRIVIKFEDGEVVEVRKFLYDGDRVVREDVDNGSGRYVNMYVWDPSLQIDSVPIACKTMFPTSSVIRYYLHDNNRNVSGIMSCAGEIETEIDYEPFGKRTLHGDESEATHFGFSSEYFERDLALVAFKYRFYDPLIGRWLASDPYETSDELNPYAFVLNEPMTHYDRLGLDTQPKEQKAPSLDDLEEGECLLHVCCGPASITRHGHCVIRFTKKDGSEIGCRGGPSGGRSGGSSGFSSAASSSGNGSSSIIDSTGSGSGSSGSDSSGSSGGGTMSPQYCGSCCGLWGSVVAGCGSAIHNPSTPVQFGINADLRHAGEHPEDCIYVKRVKFCAIYVWLMKLEMWRISRTCYIYAPLGNNSNTTWMTAYRNVIGDQVPQSNWDWPGNPEFNSRRTCK